MFGVDTNQDRETTVSILANTVVSGNSGGWTWHAKQWLKGGAALLKLAALGGVGYLAGG